MTCQIYKYNDVEEWVITLIDSVGTLKELRIEELYWIIT